MLARLTSKNRLTLPRAATASVDATDYFDVTVEDGRIILTPIRVQAAQAVRAKLERFGITEQDVEDAVAWGRQ
ncbi:MAG: AbrB/MazE/SpoVT family DNA-binding domain-containing protein [Burkholderiaceae bacterium]